MSQIKEKYAERLKVEREEMEFIKDFQDPLKPSLFRLPSKFRAALSAPFPPEALKEYPGAKHLSTIKAAWVINRLNSVFGLGGWDIITDREEIIHFPVYATEWTGSKTIYKLNTDGQRIVEANVPNIVLKCRILIREFNLATPPQYGAWPLAGKNQEVNDAFKSAQTDAISKIAGNYLEVGIHVFMGMQSHNSKPEHLRDLKPFTSPPVTSKYRDMLNERYIDVLMEQQGMAKVVHKTEDDTPPNGSSHEQDQEVQEQSVPAGNPVVPKVTAESDPREREFEAAAKAPVKAEQGAEIKPSQKGRFFPLDLIANADNAPLAVRAIESMGWTLSADEYSEASGNTKITIPGLVRWYESVVKPLANTDEPTAPAAETKVPELKQEEEVKAQADQMDLEDQIQWDEFMAALAKLDSAEKFKAEYNIVYKMVPTSMQLKAQQEIRSYAKKNSFL